ncbi:WYL domain-containing protein [Flavihumibacter sp. UBA7668]|uniref:WYL domain-containing protein n=1 Tax=Flavihumibacter sp. UBA7668 TaxID=1946542 RepID=UPI0025C0C306|nr:WYL domain-containing protein [Flavihumibacter sp. UBA7668]
MSPRDYILPYYTLVHHLQQTVGANREELMTALHSAGCDLSLRSFQRLLESLRADLGIQISYDAASNKYLLDEMPVIQLGNFFRYCKWMLEAGFVLDQLKARSGEDSTIFISPAEGTAGAEWLPLLAKGIEVSHLLRISIRQNKGEENKSYTILPVALKKEEEDWILLAWHPKKEKWRQIAVGRILELQEKAPGTDIYPPQSRDAIRQFHLNGKSSKK